MANGLGGGYILNGQLIRGAHGNAAELGHLLRVSKIRPTLRNLAEYLKRPLGDITFEEIDAMFNHGDKKNFSWLDKAIKNLKPSLDAIAVLMDPQAIVLGGRFPPAVINYIIENLTLTDYGKYWDAVARPELVAAKNFSADAAVYGAAALPLYTLLVG